MKRREFLLLPLLAACGRVEEGTPPAYGDRPLQSGGKPVYLLGVHPLHNPRLLFERYQPLADFLNRRMPDIEIRLEASRDYPSYDEKLFAGRFELALPNPYQTIEAVDRGYRVFAKMGEDKDFRGIWLTRRDSGIETPRDLIGKAVAYPAPSALAATMMPQWYLKQHGVDVMKDLDNHYVGSQESSILNVVQGAVAAAATWPPPWRAFQRRQPELAAQLHVIWQTETLPNNSLVARRDVPPERVARLRELLTTLHTHEEGRAILGNMENPFFAAADDAVYDPVRRFITRFRAEVRDPRAEK